MPSYTAAELKAIGEKCSPEVPPASVMQQMFLYENKRQEENEKLFHHQMIQLARIEDHSASFKAMIDAQNASIKKLDKDICRLERATRHEDLAQEHATLTKRTSALEHSAQLVSNPSTADLTAMATRLDLLSSKLSLLYAERNARNERAARVEARLDKLDDLVRCLTQQLAIDGRKSPRSVARLPIDTSDQRALDLVVPQDSPLVSHDGGPANKCATSEKGSFTQLGAGNYAISKSPLQELLRKARSQQLHDS